MEILYLRRRRCYKLSRLHPNGEGFVNGIIINDIDESLIVFINGDVTAGK